MTGYGRHRVRWSKAESAFEMQCDACLAWLPITTEFWAPKHGFVRCLTCFKETYQARQRAVNRVRRADPVYRLEQNEAQRVKRAATHDTLLEYRHAYYRANREHILDQRRILYAARKAS